MSIAFIAALYLQDEADLSVGAKRFVVEDRAALADPEVVARPDQLVVIAADIGIDRFVAHAMDREVRRYQDASVLLAQDADVGDQPAGARRRIFRPCRLAEQLFDPRAKPYRVIRDDEQGVARIPLGHVGRRNLVDRVIGHHLLPFLEPPFVQQGGFAIEEILHLLPGGQSRRAHAALLARRTCGSVINWFHRRQKARIWSSSVIAGCSRFIPREISDHSTSRLRNPRWQDSSISTSSGVANPPGP